jgi:hypothetical protein
MVHVWYHMYEREYAKTNVGVYVYLHLLEELKRTNVKHLYFGSAYGKEALYKTRFYPLEWWDGREWVRDEEGKGLRALLRGDVLRRVPLLDAWRKVRKPYKDAGYGFVSTREEMHWLVLLNEGFPRLAALGTMFVGALLFAQAYLSWVG